MKVGRILSRAVPNVDEIDVELLLASVLETTRGMMKAYPERELSAEEKEKFDILVQRRSNGEPVAYLVGHKEFWSLDFIVTPDVLIPRADTELLVEMALENLEQGNDLRVLDMGTGCGAIALSIASERKDVQVVATDASAEALQIAKLNAKHLQITNVEFALGDWYTALGDDKKFNMIVSNPPYVADFDPHLEQGDLRFEPNTALVGGSEGMDYLRHIVGLAPKYLFAGGQLMVEHGYDQEALVRAEFEQAGFSNITCYKDIAGIPRVTAGRH